MEEWKEYRLGDVCDISIGRTPPRAESEWFNPQVDFYNWISIKDMGVCGKHISSTSETISIEGQKRFNIPLVLPNTVILSFKLTVGRVAITSNKIMLTNEAIAQLPINDSNILDNDFLYYYLKNYNYSTLGSTSSIATAVNSKMVKDITILCPSLPTQKKIASILSSLDDKIEVNRRINENLEQQAQALYKSWFVDFEPFREGEFVESELGRIPKGWRVAKIKDIPHTLNTGKRPKGGAIASGVPSIGAEQLKGLCNYDYAKTKYISKEYSQSIPKGKVIGYEVYLNRVGGKPGDYIQNTTMFGEGYPYENCYINDHVFKLDFMQNRGYNVYIYFTFLTSRIKKYLNACGGKAAIPVINKQNIDDIYVFLPENEYVIKFGKSILPIMNIIFKNGLESARLAELRDMLLPKLMSGEINVNEVKI